MLRSLPAVYLPRRRGWQFALGEATLMLAVLSGWYLVRFGHDALLVLYEDGGWRVVLVCALSVTCLYGCDLYECPVLGDWREQWRRLPLAVGALALLLALWEWLPLSLEPGPRMAVWSLAAALGAVLACRAVWRLRARHAHGRATAAVIGCSTLAADLYCELQRHGELGWRVAGRLSDPQPESLGSLTHRGARVWATHLLAAFPGGWEAVDPSLREALCAAGCHLEDGASWYGRLSGKLALPAPIGVSRRKRVYLVEKRLLDMLVAGLALVVAAPLLALLAWLIRLDSAGPAIFRQQRVGHCGRTFTIFKFRTMFTSASALPCTPAGKQDPRCTRVGHRLRRLRLDELPQLVNILRGDMSLVGPRPFVLDQEQACCRAIAGYTQRWQVLPGATGWAQVNRGYCATIEDNREKLAYDLFYIQNQSLWFDFTILFQTLKVVCFGRGGR